MRRAWPQVLSELREIEGLRLPLTDATLAFNIALDDYIKVTTNKPRLAALREWRARILREAKDAS